MGVRWPVRLLAAASVVALALPLPVAAQERPELEVGSGMMVVSLVTPDGPIQAYLPDDVGPGEWFSGTVLGPSGYVVRLATQLVETGRSFRAMAPRGDADAPLQIVFARQDGPELATASVQSASQDVQEVFIKVPVLVQAGALFAIRGPFDGDAETTRVMVGDTEVTPLAESPRKVIVRAPPGLIGPAAFSVQEQQVTQRGRLRSLVVELRVPPEGASAPVRDLTVQGLAGIDRDVPIDISTTHFYLKATDVPPSGTFTLRRRMSDDDSGVSAALVIPQSRREEIAVILRTPLRAAGTVLGAQHARDLGGLEFDTIPVMTSLLHDDRLSSEAANALLALDEVRGMALVFESMPRSSLSVQRIGFGWFLEHQDTIGRRVDAAAHDAAVRVLARIASTANAELAIYTLGLTGGMEDFALLGRFARSTATVDGGLRTASEASLARLGSTPHLDAIRGELEVPLPERASYAQGIRLTEVLRTAALSGDPVLVPAICGHIEDPVILQFDVSVDPGSVAAGALSRILEASGSVLTRVAPRRSTDDWKAYCTRLNRR